MCAISIVSTGGKDKEANRIAIANAERVYIYEVATGQFIQTLRGHSSHVITIAWNRDGRLCSGGSDGTVRVWEVETGECIQTLHHPCWVTAVSWSDEEFVRVWELHSDTYDQTLYGHSEERTSRTEGRICSNTYDQTLRVWESSGECINTVEQKTQTFGEVWGNDGRMFRGYTGSPRLNGHILKGHIREVTSITWLNDGRLCTGSADHTVKVWGADGSCLQTLEGHSGKVISVSWSDDGRICSGSEDKTMRVWEVSPIGCIQPLQGHTAEVTSISWSTDGRICSGSADGTMRVWDVLSGKCTQIFRGHSGKVNAMAWSGDSKICSGSDGQEVRIWDVSTGEGRLLGKHASSVVAVSWTSDGRICSVSRGGAARVWDLTSDRWFASSTPIIPDYVPRFFPLQETEKRD